MFIKLTNVENKKIALCFEEIEEMEETILEGNIAATILVMKDKEEKRVLETIDQILKQNGRR